MKTLVTIITLLFVSPNLLEAKPQKKIIALSIPKCGTSLLYKAINSISTRKLYQLGVQTFDPNAIFKMNQYSGISHHLFPQFDCVLTIYRHQFAPVIIIRDLRDMLVSLYYFALKAGIGDPNLENELHSMPKRDGIIRVMEYFKYESPVKNKKKPVDMAIR